jgi:hypothetical protein
MKRLTVGTILSLVLALVLALPTMAQTGPRVRVVHASPDAPAVDVWVDGSIAFEAAPFKGITSYATLTAGSHNVQVVPSGATEPVVIDATLDLQMDQDYTVVAVGQLADIEPLVLADNNAAPAEGKAHVRFVHASPNAPEVDIAVADGGPVLFGNIEFKEASEYLPVDAGTYDLEARPAGTTDVALSVPGVALEEGNVYTIFAMGLLGEEPALTAVASVDATAEPTTLPATGGISYTLYAGLALAGLGLIAMGYGVKRFALERA